MTLRSPPSEPNWWSADSIWNSRHAIIPKYSRMMVLASNNDTRILIINRWSKWRKSALGPSLTSAPPYLPFLANTLLNGTQETEHKRLKESKARKLAGFSLAATRQLNWRQFAAQKCWSNINTFRFRRSNRLDRQISNHQPLLHIPPP